MAVTYTLDLRALLAAPAAFALTGPDGMVADDEQLEPVELLHALRSHASKITVFNQAGYTAVPPSRRVFAFLEGAVIPVDAPRGGIVHPKVWVLRYEACEGVPNGQARQQRLRVLVASRNLTFDPSWDAVLRLDESPDASGTRLEPVGELFEGLLEAAVGDVAEPHRQRVRSLAAALQTATFALPDGVDDLRVHVFGLDGRHSSPTGSPFPADADRSLVISPFVSDGFFSSVHPHPITELVSLEAWPRFPEANRSRQRGHDVHVRRRQPDRARHLGRSDVAHMIRASRSQDCTPRSSHSRPATGRACSWVQRMQPGRPSTPASRSSWS